MSYPDELDALWAAHQRPGPMLVPKSVAAKRAPEPEPEPEPVFERVQQAAVRRDTGEVIRPASVAKGYEVEKGRYIVINPEELKSIGGHARFIPIHDQDGA